MTTNTTVQNTQEVREAQMIVPTWMEKILADADKQNKQVEVTRQYTPFGTFIVAVEICK